MTGRGSRRGGAREPLLTRADIGTAPGWATRTRKPDLSGNIGCANFQPGPVPISS